ncbi:MAG: HlyD family efflux transporter periplasmic adaptor subunit [Clostridiales bacterium]|nr:HlyD family efflux transporter periplasmic adaptor subunit [Clostridiales bacterium]
MEDHIVKKMKWKRIKEVIRKGKKKWIITICLLCVVAAGAGNVISKKSRAKGTEPGMQMSATVQTGTIQTSVSGTGTISYADSSEIVIPEELTIAEVKVSEGSSVTEGTLLATVDEASLTNCLSEVQDAISEVDDTIASEKSSTTSKSVTAGVAGRVKKIYAAEDENVEDVMTQSGAMMLVSSDGTMCVTVSGNANVSVGDTVTVSAGDTETEGTVEEITDGSTVVTFDDSVFDYEEEVTITNDADITLGKGKAEIHQPISVIATSGTIASVNVDENDNVSASTKVITLDGTEHTAEYIQAIKERESLVGLLNTLIDIQKNGGIVAKADGVVTAINIDNASSSSSDSGSKSTAIFSEATEEDTYYAQVDEVASDTGDAADGLEESDTLATGFATMGTSVLGISNVVENDATQEQQAVTTQTETTGEISPATLPKTTETASTEQSTITATDNSEKTTEQSASQPEDSDTSEKTSKQSSEKKSTEQTQQDTKQENAGNTGGAGNSGSTGTVTTTQESDTVSTMTAFTIEEGDQMTVTMYVDELDVLSMKEGLQAEITLDAVEDTTFEGTITSVGAQASSSGGVAQYPVNITFDKTEDMLSGMNASVKVILEEAGNVLTIPLTAVTEEGNTVIVIEHNLDVIKTADYIIDIGPEGGDRGGTVVAYGTPEEVAKNSRSYTGKYLDAILKKNKDEIKRKKSPKYMQKMTTNF